MNQKSGERSSPDFSEKNFNMLHKQLAEAGLVCYNHTILRGICENVFSILYYNIRRIQL